MPNGLARDRPPPYGKQDVFFTVARGPVPRDPSTYAKTTRRLRHLPPDRCMARDRPSPYGEGEAASPTVARGPVPRDPSRARWLGEGQALALDNAVLFKPDF